MSAPRIHRLVKSRASGWPVAMHVVELGNGGTIVHSPTWIGDDALAAVKKLGAPRYLFAPNYFHWLGLPRYRSLFPDATPVASRGAIPRLTSKGNQGLVAIEEAKLPDGARWLVPEGTKSGEAWIAIDGDQGTEWIVCDAFFNEPSKITGLEGMFLRLAKTSPGLCLGETFKRLCVKDKPRYVEWVVAALERERPQRIHFSHGEPLPPPGIAKSDVVGPMAEILRARLS